MDLLHRVLHPGLEDPTDCLPDCYPPDCRPVCILKPPPIADRFQIPPPPPSSPHTLSPALIIVIAILSSAFLLVSYYAIIVKYCANWRRRRVPATQNNPPADEEFDEAATPMNYIWYVSTVGLEESVINSIAVCKYKKGDGLIEGTECSVCLNEFREDEDLRLLPKCSHAFHVPCIDTWLKSHVNCPLCRANVVSKQEGSSATASNSTSAGSSAGGGVEVSNSTAGSSEMDEENQAELQLQREDGRLEVEIPEIAPFPRLDFGIRVYSDLGQNLRSGGFAMEEMDKVMQPVRRSFSMDSSAAALIRLSLANLPPAEPVDKKVNLGESSEAKRNGPIHKGGQSQALIKVMSHGCKGSSLFKGPVAMKRSFSSGGKFFLSRNSRSRNSVLPL